MFDQRVDYSMYDNENYDDSVVTIAEQDEHLLDEELERAALGEKVELYVQTHLEKCENCLGMLKNLVKPQALAAIREHQ